MEKEDNSDVFYAFSVNGKRNPVNYHTQIQAELEASIQMVAEGANSYTMYEFKPLDISSFIDTQNILQLIAVSMYQNSPKAGLKCLDVFSSLKEKDYEELSKRFSSVITNYFEEVKHQKLVTLLNSWEVHRK